MSQRVLITGGNGFVGSALVPYLLKQSFSVIASTRSSEFLPPGVTPFPIVDLSDDMDWRGALEGVDTVFHLAGRAHVMGESKADALAAHRKINVDVTRNLGKQTVDHGVRRFVYISSIKVNGEATTDTPFSARDPVDPKDPYGLSKLEAEQALKEVLEGSNTDLVIVRPPLIYGPGVKANFLSLLGLVRKRWPLPLANLDNRRSMISLTNLCDVLSRCATEDGALGRTFLVSDDDDVSTSRLLRLMSIAMKSKSGLFPFPVSLLKVGASLVGKGAQVNRLCGSLQVDISDTKRCLSWAPPLSVEQGVARVSEWYLRTYG
ncbi:MAG: SDR family oxidoreductase [Pseudomonadota bacterium]